MKWSNHHTRKQMTTKAQGEEGRTYEVVSTGTMNPARAYSVKHEPNRRPDKKTLIARVPTISLAVLATEQVERWEQNGDLHNEDPTVAKRAQETRDALNAEPRFTYTFSVPVSQITTVQEALHDGGLDIHLNCMTPHRAAVLKRAILPLAGLWKAINAVNEDLDMRGVQPNLPGPHLIEPYSAANRETTELLLLMQTHYRWDTDQTLLENLWVKDTLEWSEIIRKYPTLFPRQGNRAKQQLNPAT